jgi:hypothetical protein
MTKDCNSKAVVREVFDDVALLIGSVASARRLPDDLVHALIKRLDRVRVRTLSRLSDDHVYTDLHNNAEPPRIHPAVEDFLFRNGQGDTK